VDERRREARIRGAAGLRAIERQEALVAAVVGLVGVARSRVRQVELRGKGINGIRRRLAPCSRGVDSPQGRSDLSLHPLLDPCLELGDERSEERRVGKESGGGTWAG